MLVLFALVMLLGLNGVRDRLTLLWSKSQEDWLLDVIGLFCYTYSL